jgi:hypothetical protein
MSGKLTTRIRRLLLKQFSNLDIFVRSKRDSKVTGRKPYTEPWPWERVYRNVKKLYIRNPKDREFFKELMKKENI